MLVDAMLVQQDAYQTPTQSERHLPYQAKAKCELDVDYAVVGSGAGGAAAGVELSRAGYEVALVESGVWLEPQDYPESVFGAARDVWSDWAQLTTRGNSLIPILQACAMGGSTTINSAIVMRTPEDVIADWSARGFGDVFSAESLGAAQDQIEKDLHVQPASGHRQQTRNNRLMLQALRQRGMEAHATERAAEECRGSGRCLQGCRSGAKQSTNVTWVPEILRRNGWIFSCAPVERVFFENGRAVGVVGRFRHPRSRKYGSPYVIRARRGVLLAASATGTAPLLQKSGVRLPYLGYGWRGHPGAGIVGLYPERVDMIRGTTQGAASMELRHQPGIKLESLGLPPEVLCARLPGAGHEFAEHLEKMPYMACWVAAVRAEAVGHVKRSRLGETVVRYSPTTQDVAALRHGAVELAKLHFAVGATAVYTGVHGMPSFLLPRDLHLLERAPLDNRCWTWVLTHLFGGAVFGKDPASSVVNPELHVWGHPRLHVVDASALPTTLGVNPQHTIMAVAMVTARRLANQELLS